MTHIAEERKQQVLRFTAHHHHHLALLFFWRSVMHSLCLGMLVFRPSIRKVLIGPYLPWRVDRGGITKGIAAGREYNFVTLIFWIYHHLPGLAVR